VGSEEGMELTGDCWWTDGALTAHSLQPQVWSVE
jgi:hypothetical protein